MFQVHQRPWDRGLPRPSPKPAEATTAEKQIHDVGRDDTAERAAQQRPLQKISGAAPDFGGGSAVYVCTNRELEGEVDAEIDVGAGVQGDALLG